MKKLWVVSLLCLASFSAQSAVVLIGNPAADELSKSDAKKLFLGKMKSVPGGGKAVLVELQDGNPLRIEFHDKVTGKSESQLQSYWSRLIFTGKASAPAQMTSIDQVKQKVAANTGAVGYIDEADVDGTVKVLYKP
ncbi:MULTISPECIES: phosphate ABC transporter substrate-binding protein [Corallincola]|uniref:Phosphate ABC transporter substrate-binding protein n=3 Tax=Corallincola TaxID=1775176 RepID=A0A368NN12_9GAMM|nr:MULTISPECIES: phosphate ABC transporter substrate-binding protein [Corallincola]RCU51798.1 phosphate ABC transporter substrate-binding protein [Corallincola holothuriorum]TAA47290.1 phosphate ABC transporter substrate-binding protein [Corallincola spongiicola]TCI04950.1 phosphate ABC transporter substrate-binding protein [Corallincola luteus]